MGSTKKRPSAKGRRKPPARSKRTQRGARGGLRRFLFTWIGVIVVVAGIGIGLKLWSGNMKSGPQAARNREAPKPQQQRVKVSLYFADDQAEFLIPERRSMLQKKTPAEMAKSIMKGLIAGPRGDLLPTIPQGTRLVSVAVTDEGICTVDLSKELQRNHPGGTSSELMTVYSIVESLTSNIPKIHAVKIMVEGRSTETLAGHLYIGEPLRSQPKYVHRKRS